MSDRKGFAQILENRKNYWARGGGGASAPQLPCAIRVSPNQGGNFFGFIYILGAYLLFPGVYLLPILGVYLPNLGVYLLHIEGFYLLDLGV